MQTQIARLDKHNTNFRTLIAEHCLKNTSCNIFHVEHDLQKLIVEHDCTTVIIEYGL